MHKATTIVLTGKMKSGKDEFARILREKISLRRLGLADSLKALVAEAHGISVAELEFRKAEFRKDLILVGKVGRLLDENTWIDLLDNVFIWENDCVVTDARFKNEVEAFKRFQKGNHRVFFIRILAEDSTRIGRGAQEEFFNDPSETSLDDIPDSEFDYIIWNNGPLSELEDAADDFITNFFHK